MGVNVLTLQCCQPSLDRLLPCCSREVLPCVRASILNILPTRAERKKFLFFVNLLISVLWQPDPQSQLRITLVLSFPLQDAQGFCREPVTTRCYNVRRPLASCTPHQSYPFLLWLAPPATLSLAPSLPGSPCRHLTFHFTEKNQGISVAIFTTRPAL